MNKTLLTACLLPLSLSVSAADLDMATKIRQEGFYNSHVMETVQHLTDTIGPRLTGSPQMNEANRWTMSQLKQWGADKAWLDGFEFGRGWSHDSVSINLVTPRKVSIQGLPVAWTPGTQGTVEGSVVMFDAATPQEFANYQGKLKGKILMLGPAKPIEKPNQTVSSRLDGATLGKQKNFEIMKPPSHTILTDLARRDRIARWYTYQEKLSDFLKQEQVAAVMTQGRRQGGLLHATGMRHEKGLTFSTPYVVVSAEDYNLLHRLIDKGHTPKVSMNVAARFHDEDSKAYNTIAEITGQGRDPEIVMAGAHLDSWHGSPGGVDNAAGVAVVMEAVRILKALEVKPKRSIRVALWSGEEQGLYGSRHYVDKYLATRPRDPEMAKLPEYLWWDEGWPIQPRAEYDRFSAYFNMDNGSGKFRGIMTEGNLASGPVFQDWFGPYRDLDTGTVSNNSNSGTDHEPFDDVGLPGFQFIQDPLDYRFRLHHTNIDTYDHVIEADLKQASVIMAGFLYEAAMADKPMPRKPMPLKPTTNQQRKFEEKGAKERRDRERDAKQDLDMRPYGT